MKISIEEKHDIMNEWIKRLRSNEYEQGIGLLRNEKDEFCCLGILCEIGFEKGFLDRKFDYLNLIYKYISKASIFNEDDIIDSIYECRSTSLPEKFSKLLGMDRDGKFKDENGNHKELVDINDFYETPFDEIADIIEKNKTRIFYFEG